MAKCAALLQLLHVSHALRCFLIQALLCVTNLPSAGTFGVVMARVNVINLNLYEWHA